MNRSAQTHVPLELHEKKMRDMEQRFFQEAREMLDKYEQNTKEQLRAVEDRKNSEFGGVIQQLRDGVALLLPL